MSHDRFDVVLAGNNLTTLVAALGLAHAGRRVCVVNPVPTWGGHFTRFNVAGMSFDPGAISHEFTAFDTTGHKDPLDYDAKRRNDWGRFAGLIEEFTRHTVDSVRMQDPQVVYAGELLPDIVMTNQMGLLLHPVLAGRVRTELDHILASPPGELHPRYKKDSALFLQRSYYEVSIAAHGATLHAAVFDPLFYKMSAISTARLIALYHRIAWLPLYYPETLRSQFGPHPQRLQETYFCYPKAGYMGVLAETLLQRVQTAGATVIREGVVSLESRPGRANLVLKEGRRLETPHLVWSLAHDPLVTAVTHGKPNAFERWSATLVFVTIPRQHMLKSFSVLYAPDDRILFYRASNQTGSAGLDEEAIRAVIEVNPDFAEACGILGEKAIAARVRVDLTALGIVSEPNYISVAGVRTLRNVLLLPCQENWRLLELERDLLLEQYPGVIFTRNVEAFFTDTLNDQIIKGLRLVEQLRAA